MVKRLAAGLVVLGLAVGIWLLWPGRDTGAAPTTLAAETTTSTATTRATTTSTTAPTTTETTDSHVVTTVEEAEEILRELWFGWFEGIYHQDEARIREVVATENQVKAAKAQFGVMEFASPPTKEAIALEDTELYRSDHGCLAVWSQVSASFRPGGTQSLFVLRWSVDRWLFASSWQHPGDLWEADCEAQLQPLP